MTAAEATDLERLRRDPLGFVRRLARTDASLPEFTLGRTRCVLVRDPAKVREVFVEQLDELGKPMFLRDSNRGHWGEGLTTLEGDRWRERRALLRPLFTPERLARHRAPILEHARGLVSRLAPGSTTDLRRTLRLWVARMAARLVFDAELEGLGTPAAVQARAGVIPVAEAYGEDFSAMATEDGRVPLALTRPRAPRQMPATLALIDDRLRRPRDRGDVLSGLVVAGLPRDVIADELIQMLYAGHHTIVATLLHLWRRLADHPEVVHRLRARAPEVLEGGPTAGTLVDRVLRETMRMHPPAPLLYREALAPVALGGVPLAAGTAIWACPLLLHHDPRYFPQPDRFAPERFERGATPPVPAHAYLPFGAGPRRCIAHRLAMTQMTLLVATVVAAVDLRPAGGDRFAVLEPG